MRYLRDRKTYKQYCVTGEDDRRIEICDENGKHKIIRKCMIDKWFF